MPRFIAHRLRYKEASLAPGRTIPEWEVYFDPLGPIEARTREAALDEAKKQWPFVPRASLAISKERVQ